VKTIFVGITGASGVTYGLRLVDLALAAGHQVVGCASEWGQKVVGQETGVPWADRARRWNREYPETWAEVSPGALGAGPASGSYRLDGTVIIPASLSTLGHLASGAATNLIHRAGAVALKEGRTLVVVPREAPLGLIDLRNLTTLAEAGAAIVPASPGFYHHPKTIEDLVDQLVGKVLDRLGVDHQIVPRWDGKEFS
jgi:4-hydroxy-3-polyprenylbenzoate decarboxylase